MMTQKLVHVDNQHHNNSDNQQIYGIRNYVKRNSKEIRGKKNSKEVRGKQVATVEIVKRQETIKRQENGRKKLTKILNTIENFRIPKHLKLIEANKALWEDLEAQ